jgi:hypothetical protein
VRGKNGGSKMSNEQFDVFIAMLEEALYDMMLENE